MHSDGTSAKRLVEWLGAWGERRRVYLPLAIYWAVTLGIPFLNGAGARIAFWKHAVDVVAVAVALVAVRGFGRAVHFRFFRPPVGRAIARDTETERGSDVGADIVLRRREGDLRS